MKKIKKGNTKKLLVPLVLSTGVISPVAFAISCGNSDKLLVGVRAEDVDLFKNVEQQFEKATGVDVEFQAVSDVISNYTLWHNQSLIPDVALTDLHGAKTGIEKGWFDKLDLNDLATNEDYLLDQEKLDEEYKQVKDLKFDSAHFSLTMMDSAKTEDGKYASYPFIYGPKLLYIWGRKNNINILDGTKPLKWFVPSEKDGIVEVKDFGTQTNPLLKPDGTLYMNSREDIQNFLLESGNKKQMSANGKIVTDIENFVTEGDPKDRVIATGSAGLSQRVSSIAATIQEILDDDKFRIGGVYDPAISYLDVYQMLAPFKDGASINLNEDKLLDDEKWATEENTDSPKDIYSLTREDRTALSSLSNIAKIQYFSSWGYLDNTNMGSSKQLGVENVTEAFSGQQSFMMANGAKWQLGSIQEKAGENAKYLEAISVPFQETGVDSFAISAKSKKKDLAKKMIRFFMQKKAAAEIASNKASSTIIEAQPLQKTDEKTKAIDEAVKNSGKGGVKALKTSSYDKDLELFDFDYEVFKKSTKNLFDSYNNIMIEEDFEEMQNGDSMTLDIFIKRLNAISTKYKTEKENTN